MYTLSIEKGEFITFVTLIVGRYFPSFKGNLLF